jgi:hypothetical protein
MGANAVTTVPVYTAGEILTAADLNITNSGIPVFATTVTRDAAFGGTGEKTLAEGQFAYIEATDTTQYYDGASWVQVGATAGMVRVGGGTLSGNTTITGAFNSTYEAYRIVVSGLTISAGTGQLRFKLGTTATGYVYSQPIWTVGGSANAGGGGSNQSYVTLNNTYSGTSSGVIIDVINPFLSVKTMFTSLNSWNDATNFCASLVAGYVNNTTSYTSFTLEGESGNLAGTVNVYGYSLS